MDVPVSERLNVDGLVTPEYKFEFSGIVKVPMPLSVSTILSPGREYSPSDQLYVNEIGRDCCARAGSAIDVSETLAKAIKILDARRNAIVCPHDVYDLKRTRTSFQSHLAPGTDAHFPASRYRLGRASLPSMSFPARSKPIMLPLKTARAAPQKSTATQRGRNEALSATPLESPD